MGFILRQMRANDVDGIIHSFARFNKHRAQYENFWKEHQAGRRVTVLAVSGETIVGYTNLVWLSDYAPFQEDGIPEINDMHVVDEFQKQGIGTALIREAERVAAAQGIDVIGIGVGLTPDYAQAQRLYPKLGYVPDGRGIRPTPWGDTLYLTKRLIENSTSP